MKPADAALVRRDRGLPDLGVLLDEEALTERLAATCRRSDITGLSLTYLRYKPAQSCVAAARAEVGGQPIDLIVKAFCPSARVKFAKAIARPAVSGPLGPGSFMLDGMRLVVWVGANDSRLERLAALASPEGLMRVSRRLGWPACGDLALETLRHNPERRYVGRLLRNGRAVATLRCYLKADYAMARAKTGALVSRGPLRIARRLAHATWKRLLAFEYLEGDLLHERLLRGGAHAGAMELVGAALAHLHAQDAGALPRRSSTSDGAGLLRLARDLGHLHPPIAGDALRLAERLAGHLAADAADVCPIHGDFYARQVLLDADTVALLDLDEASLGDPAVDLGRFGADLEAAVLDGRLPSAAPGTLIAPLVEGYRRNGGAPVRRLDVQVAAQLFRLAAHPFRRRDAGWPSAIEATLARVDGLLDAAAPSAPRRALRVYDARAAEPGGPRGRDRVAVATDAALPALRDALCPHAMAGHLARAVPQLSSARVEIRAIEVMRHKPGRRCVIGYDLAVRGARDRVDHVELVGKVRARGADLTTHAVLRALWSGAFGAHMQDDIGVPEPVGVIEDLHMVVQRRVAGASLDALLDGQDGVRLANRVAQAMHKLHDALVPPDRVHTVEDEVRLLHERLAPVAHAHPAWNAAIVRVLAGCVRLSERVHADPICGIHRDLYPDQVLADGDRLHLLDLDLCCRGQAALDLGNFLAHMQEGSLRRHGNPDHLHDATEAIADRYLVLSNRTTRAAIDAWTVLSLVRHVAISRGFEERRPFTGALLDLCDRRVSAMLPAQ